MENKERKWVFRGKFPSSPLCPEREVAVKILGASEIEERIFKYDAGQRPTMSRRMKRESCHLHELLHPNVVQYIHSWCMDRSDRVFIVMELCHSETLEDRIQNKNERLQDPQYCKVVLFQTTQGVQYIHSKGICHRDIKPSNILFSSDERLVKVSDFGFSKKANLDTGKFSSTTSTATDGYRPPETYIKEKDGKSGDDIDYLSDVFSLGLVFFNVLTNGSHPFGDNVHERSCNIMHKKNKLLEGLTGPDAGLARDLIGSMLHYDRDRRPSTTETLKHPYFWSSNKIAGFYIRVGDHLSCDTKTSKKKITLNKAVSDFLDGRSGKSTAANAAAVDQARLYFLFERNAREKRITLQRIPGRDNKRQDNGGCCSGIHHRQKQVEESDLPWPPLQDVPKEQQEFERNARHAQELVDGMEPILEIFYSSLDERAQFYILVLNHILDIVEESKCPITKDETETAKTEGHNSGYFEAKQIVAAIQKASPDRGMDFEKTYELLGEVTTMRFSPTIRLIDIFKDKRNNMPDPNSTTKEEEKERCSASRHTYQPLRDEFYPREVAKDFNRLKDNIENASRECNVPETLKAAKELLEIYRKLPRPDCGNTPKSKSKTNHESGRTIQENAILITNINELTLTRRNRSSKGHLDELSNLVKNCEDNNDSKEIAKYLKDIYIKVGDLIAYESKGEKRTWKACLTDEPKIHGSDCVFEIFVKESMSNGNKISDFISYVRNKLAHFEDDKRKFGQKWMQTPEELLHLVAAALPELLPHVYKVMKEELKEYIEAGDQHNHSL